MGATTTQTLQIVLTSDGQGGVTAALGSVVGGIKQIPPAANEATTALDKIAGSLGVIKAVMAAWGITEILKEAVGGFLEANAAAQQLQATLIAVTGDAGSAKAVYSDLSAIADSTSSKTSELVGAYVRLQNAGLQPTNELLTSMANIAVGTGTTIDQVANAMAAAYEGNARGLKQLGIVAQDAGDKIILSFQGQKTVIDNSAEGLADFFNKFGQSEQFIAAQEASVNSLGGAWHQFWKTLEDDAISGNGLIGGTISLLTKLIQMATAVAKGPTTGTPEANYNASQGGYSTGFGGEGGAVYTPPATSFAQANAQTQANLALLKQVADQAGLTNAATEIYNDTLGKLATTLREVISEHQAENAELDNAAADTALANKAVSDLTDKLKDKAATIGVNSVQAVQYALSTGKMAAADDDHRRAALAAAQAVDTATAVQKAAQQIQKQMAEDSSYIDNLQKELDLVGATHNEQILYNADLAASKAANEEDANAIRTRAAALVSANQDLADATQLAKENQEAQKDNDDEIQRILSIKDAVKKVGDELDPVEAAWDKYITQMNVLDKALETLGPAYDDIIAKLKTEAAQALTTATANANGAKQLTSAWEQAGSEAGSAFSKFLSDGLKNGGKDLQEGTAQIAKTLQDYFIKQKIVIPLMAKLDGGDGSGMAAGVGALFQASSEAQANNTGAAIGTLVGAIIGTALDEFTFGMGTFIGSAIGGLIGGLFDSTKTPEYTTYGQNNIPAGAGQYTDSLGTFGLVGKHGSDDTNAQVQQKIIDFDNSIAQFLPPDQVDRVRTALASINTSMKGTDPQAIEQAHLDAVIGATDPAFQAFIDNIHDVNTELLAFQAIEKLQADLKTTASTITQLTGTPLQKLQDSLATFSTKVVNAGLTLATALATQDPTQVLTAEQALKKAVTDRYSAELADVQNLLAAEQSLEQSSYTLNLSLANKIGSLTGDMTTAVSTAADRMSSLKEQVLNDTDYGVALNDLSELQSATDDWLSAAQQQIESNFSSQIQAIEDQKSALSSSGSHESAAHQAMQAKKEAERQAEISALQKQLDLANQWLGVLQTAQQMIQDLQTSAANPLGGYSQLDLLNQAINDKFSAVFGETGTQQATDASALLTDLQQRLTLIQQGSLYDRSSPDYMAAYNQTLAQISQIEALANPYASQVSDLQKQIDALQAVKQAVSSGFSGNSAELASLNAQEDALKAQEQAQLDALNKSAAAYYVWEQGEAITLEDQRHKEIMDQLNAITGGVDPTQFIAEESSNMAASLNSIDAQITAFLGKISSGATTAPGAGGGSGGSVAPPSGTGGGGSSTQPSRGQSAQPSVSITTNVNGVSMSADDVRDIVVSEINRNIPAMASKMKRALKFA